MTIEKSIANNNTVNIPSVSEKITSTTNDSRMNHKNELDNQQRKKKKLMTRSREVGIKLRSFSSWLCLFLFLHDIWKGRSSKSTQHFHTTCLF